jgi:SPP1 family predicted phage head-tail adaptor
MLKTRAEVMKNLGKIYKDLITLKEPIETPDGQGGYKPNFQTVATVYAFVKKPRLATEVEAGGVVSELTYEIALPDRPGVPDAKKKWKVLFDQKVFIVEHAYINDYDREKILVVKEVVR